MENNTSVLNSPVTVGTFKQKANWFLIGFVFGCIFIITLLLYIMQKADATAYHINSVTEHNDISY